MKTIEFIKEIELIEKNTNIKITCEKHNDSFIVFLGDIYVAKVYSNQVGKFDFHNYNNHLLEEKYLARLCDVIIQYSYTPLKKRKEDESYYIKMKHLDSGNCYINYSHDYDYVYISDKSYKANTQIAFTEIDINELDLQKFTNNELFELVEVK